MADNNFEQNNQYPYYPPQPEPPKEEKASVGLAILSVIIPLAGLIIFLTKKDKRPKTAKTCGICALVMVIINIVITIISTVSGGILAGKAVDDMLDSDSSYIQDNDIMAEGGNESSILTGDTIGDYGCVVKEAKLCTDYDGKDAVLITYEFTNNSSEAASFDIALYDTVYQDGIGLETAFLADEETDSFDVQIKPGATKDVKKAYLLRDTTTDLEVEISESFSFTDDKLVSTVKIAK